MLYSINLRVMGTTPNITFIDEITVFSYGNSLLKIAESSIFLIVLFGYILKTDYGLGLRAAGQNKLFASVCGINVNAMIIIGLVTSKEVFIPIKIDTKKGRQANIIKPDDAFANTQLARLLAKAYLLEKRLISDPCATLNEFCRMNNISPRYLRAIISLNNLSPRIKQKIMDGYVPKHLSVQEITNHRFRSEWTEQEKWIFE